MITAWRIFQERHAGHPLSGEGARLHGGRWNSQGFAALYAASSLSLPALEMLVHLRDSPLLFRKYRCLPLTFSEELVEDVAIASLPEDWTRPEHPALKALGDEWLRAGRSLALRVPNAVIPLEANYLINPEHPDFGKILVGDVQGFVFDRRLQGK